MDFHPIGCVTSSDINQRMKFKVDVVTYKLIHRCYSWVGVECADSKIFSWSKGSADMVKY